MGVMSATDDFDSQVLQCCAIAKPLASKKLNKKILKLVKKAAKSKSIRRGVKEVVKSIRKGHKGLVVIAGDISPIDVISHIPVLCEEGNISYIYSPSKVDLGAASCTKRPTSCTMICSNDDIKELFDECQLEIKKI